MNALNNTFTDDFGSPAMHLPPITIDDKPRLHKISRHTLDLLPVDISVASENSLSTFTTYFDSPKVIVLTYNDTNPRYVINKDKPYHVMLRRGYC